MRCVVCRVMYPESQLTYRSGLCPSCLSDQLEKMAADNRMMAAAFRVIDRMLMECHAAEVKREIYEEIYAPTPEQQAITCDACGKSFHPDQITEYNGRNLHTDCYYAAMTTTLKTYNNDDDLTHDPRERVLYYKAQGLSVRKIADALRTEGITISKSAVDRIIQEQKEAQI